MKIYRNIVLAMIVIVLLCIFVQPSQGQSLEVRRVLLDRGWHGVGGNTQVHQLTIEHDAPWVGVWERSPAGQHYGQWLYVKVLMNCEQWTQIPFATIDRDANYVLMEDAIGSAPQLTWPEPGTEPYRTMTAVCGLYGYTRGRSIVPREDPRSFVER